MATDESKTEKKMTRKEMKEKLEQLRNEKIEYVKRSNKSTLSTSISSDFRDQRFYSVIAMDNQIQQL